MSTSTTIFHFRVWQGLRGNLVGQRLDIAEYQMYVRWGWRIHGFPGRRGNVIVLSEDPLITREQKLNFAIKFMEGNLIEYTINLDNLTTKTERINPPPDY